jgi:tetratricopeptide (TPR) repeat protein
MEKKEWSRLESNIIPPFSSADAKIKGASAAEKSGAPGRIRSSVNENLEKALPLIEAEKYSEALALLAAAYTTSSGSFEQCVVMLNQSKCLMLLGRFREAQERLDSVSKRGVEGDMRLYVECARINLLYAEQKTGEALEKSRSFLAVNREVLQQEEYEDMVYDLRLRAAFGAVTSGRFDSGIKELNRFIKLAKEEDQSRIHLFLGIAFGQLGKYKEAINEFELVLLSSGHEELIAEAHYRLGAIHFKVGAFAWAQQRFTEAESSIDSLKAVPIGDLYTFLAQTYGHLGNEEQRERYIAMARDDGKK